MAKINILKMNVVCDSTTLVIRNMKLFPLFVLICNYRNITCILQIPFLFVLELHLLFNIRYMRNTIKFPPFKIIKRAEH